LLRPGLPRQLRSLVLAPTAPVRCPSCRMHQATANQPPIRLRTTRTRESRVLVVQVVSFVDRSIISGHAPASRHRERFAVAIPHPAAACCENTCKRPARLKLDFGLTPSGITPRGPKRRAFRVRVGFWLRVGSSREILPPSWGRRAALVQIGPRGRYRSRQFRRVRHWTKVQYANCTACTKKVWVGSNISREFSRQCVGVHGRRPRPV
jgi:hypothetical protein